MHGRTQRSLKGLRVFSDLPPEALAEVERRCRWREVPARSDILHSEDQSNDVFFIADGQVRAILYSAAGKAVTFRDLRAGDMFGELAALDGQPRSATIQAVSDCLVAQLSAKAFWELLLSEPALDKAVLMHLVRLVRSLSTRVYEFSTLAVRNRIHAELLRLARETGEAGERGVVIAAAPTHAEIASRISTHREAVAREMSRLARLGVIGRRGAGVIVPDVDRLARMVAAATDE
ncbi:MAG: Crp/Fnr family transcriptional regulator [Hyphomicrobiaceae bacterium]|nr:Crp/Fnr family transcriptional regulator [Hyphomicrobiaceae bacterium]